MIKVCICTYVCVFKNTLERWQCEKDSLLQKCITTKRCYNSTSLHLVLNPQNSLYVFPSGDTSNRSLRRIWEWKWGMTGVRTGKFVISRYCKTIVTENREYPPRCWSRRRCGPLRDARLVAIRPGDHISGEESQRCRISASRKEIKEKEKKKKTKKSKKKIERRSTPWRNRRRRVKRHRVYRAS